MYQATPFIFYPNLSDLVLLDTTLSLVCAKCRICNERKERDPIFLCTNENGQLQSAGGMGQLGATNWAQSNELKTIRGSQLVS